MFICCCRQLIVQAAAGFAHPFNRLRGIAPPLLAETDRLISSSLASATSRSSAGSVEATKHGDTRHRHVTAMRAPAFDLIRNLPLLETRAEHFLRACLKKEKA